MKKSSMVLALVIPVLAGGAVAAYASTVSGFLPSSGTRAVIARPVQPLVEERSEVPLAEEEPVVGVTPPDNGSLEPVEYVPTEPPVVGVTPPEGVGVEPVEYVPSEVVVGVTPPGGYGIGVEEHTPEG